MGSTQYMGEPCSRAASSRDARDKYFLVGASITDAGPARALAAELPHLDLAVKSLATVMAALFDASPHLASCTGHGSGLLGANRVGGKAARGRTGFGASGFPVASELLREARSLIVHFRTCLK